MNLSQSERSEDHRGTSQQAGLSGGKIHRVPLNVHLYITPLCNLTCVHCYYDARVVGQSTGELLPSEDIALIVRTLAERYEADIHMEGGEAFLRSDLACIMDLVPDPYWSTVTITTNGVTRIAIGADRLRKFGDVRVSVEGHTDQMQRRLRRVGLKGVLATCKQLEADGVAMTLRITLHRMNIGCVRDMLRFFLDRGHTRFSLFELQPVGRGRELDDLFLRESELTSALEDLAAMPPDPRLRSLKLSLPHARLPLVERNAVRLREQGYEVRPIGGVPSLTINSDGEMGVSAWSITADGAVDRIDSFRRDGFAEQVDMLLSAGSLSRPCPYSSEVSIRYNRASSAT